MKQVLQDARSAEITVADVPVPKLLRGCALIRTAASVVSAGTERAASEFAGKSLLQKARMRPDLVREVVNKIKRDGFVRAASAVRSRLDQPSVMGYSSAGTVIALGEGITGLNPGDRVSCAGAGYAVHAEFACVPRLLMARIPASVSFDEAAFTTLGAVALHGVRNAEAKLGDIVAVIGLGLLGQLTVQILKAAGCTVLATDLSAERADLARRLGADAVSTSASGFHDLCRQHSAGHGVDSVIIAAQTDSNDPVNLAGAVARSRAVVVAVGTVAMDIPRRSFYEKELDFRVSRSYGPGRYDAAYEQKGIDYPIGYVRWTETRNMEAFLKLLEDRKLDLRPLTSHRFPVAQSHSAYELINGKTQEAFLGVLIEYPESADDSQVVHLSNQGPIVAKLNAIRIGLLGAGNFATSTLLPAIQKVGGVELVVACAGNGAHARHAAGKFKFRSCTTDEREVFDHPEVNTVIITTRHNLHASQVIGALHCGKHVFCEKPLCLNETELAAILAAHSAFDAIPAKDERSNNLQPGLPALMVGFNRRFAPFAIRLKSFLREVGEPLAIHYRVNAGFLPADHWLNDPQQGGGRILGEVCHFVDFLQFLTGAAIAEVETRSLPNPGQYSNDNLVCQLRFADGSQGTISYLACGDKSFSKERIEVFGGGSVAVLEDFRRLELIRGGARSVARSFLRQDKGHRGEWAAFLEAIRSGSGAPIPLAQVVNTMRATFALEESRSLGQAVAIQAFGIDESRLSDRGPGATDLHQAS
jgi:predicted dehydrogenase/threonine dehydrogenase-like Zn-dependent dehydrogenase